MSNAPNASNVGDAVVHHTNEDISFVNSTFFDPVNREALFRAENEELSNLVENHDTEAVIVRLRISGYNGGNDAAEALGKIGDPLGVDPLCIALRDGDRSVRRAAAIALGEIGDERAIPHLIVALSDYRDYLDYLNVRDGAIDSIIKFGRSAVEPLLSLLDSQIKSIRDASAFCLGRIGGEDLFKPLHKLGYKIEAMTAVKDVVGLVSITKTNIMKNRVKALEAIRYSNDEKVESDVINLLDDSNDIIRIEAIRTLSKMNCPKCITYLIKLIDKDSRVSFEAIRALGEFKDVRAVEPLLSDLDILPYEGTAIETLGNIGDPRAVKPLLNYIENDDGGLRWSAAVAIGKLPEFPIEQITEILYDEKHPNRRAAVKALDAWEDDRSTNHLLDAIRLGFSSDIRSDFVDRRNISNQTLVKLLDDSNDKIRKYAIQACGKKKVKVAVNKLIKILKTDNKYNREEAIISLGLIGEPQALESLIDTFYKNDYSNFFESLSAGSLLTAISQIGGGLAYQTICKALESEIDRVRQEAVWNLRYFEKSKSIKLLINILTTGTENEKRNAIRTLCVYMDNQALPDIIKCFAEDDIYLDDVGGEVCTRFGTILLEPFDKIIKDKNAKKRDWVAYIAHHIGTPSIKSINKLLNEKTVEIRSSAISSLGFIGKDSMEHILPLLNDTSDKCRSNAVEALRDIADYRAVIPLIKFIEKEKNKYSIKNAIKILGYLEDSQAISIISQSLNHQDENIRKEAAIALGKIGDKASLDVLIAALSDNKEDVRLEVAIALGEIGDLGAIEPLTKTIDSEESEFTLKQMLMALDSIGTSKTKTAQQVKLDNLLNMKKQLDVLGLINAIGDTSTQRQALEILHNLTKNNKIKPTKQLKTILSLDNLLVDLADVDSDHIIVAFEYVVKISKYSDYPEILKMMETFIFQVLFNCYASNYVPSIDNIKEIKDCGYNHYFEKEQIYNLWRIAHDFGMLLWSWKYHFSEDHIREIDQLLNMLRKRRWPKEFKLWKLEINGTKREPRPISFYSMMLV